MWTLVKEVCRFCVFVEMNAFSKCREWHSGNGVGNLYSNSSQGCLYSTLKKAWIYLSLCLVPLSDTLKNVFVTCTLQQLTVQKSASHSSIISSPSSDSSSKKKQKTNSVTSIVTLDRNQSEMRNVIWAKIYFLGQKTNFIKYILQWYWILWWYISFFGYWMTKGKKIIHYAFYSSKKLQTYKDFIDEILYVGGGNEIQQMPIIILHWEMIYVQCLNLNLKTLKNFWHLM